LELPKSYHKRGHEWGGVSNEALATSEKHVTRHTSPNKTELRNLVFHSHNSRNRDALRKAVMGISNMRQPNAFPPTQVITTTDPSQHS
jgi:hypothetical protein